MTLEKIESHARVALALAIARYLADHPDVAGRAGTWSDDAVARWRRRPVADMQAEATRLLEDLEAWKLEAENSFPEVWRTERVEYINTKLTLQSAHSGSFASAAGSLYSFLVDVGASPQALKLR